MARSFARLFSGALLPRMLLAQSAPPAEPVSREEVIASEQARKAAQGRPPKRDRAEELILKAEKMFLVDPSGFFPYFDSVYQGGGLTPARAIAGFMATTRFGKSKGSTRS